MRTVYVNHNREGFRALGFCTKSLSLLAVSSMVSDGFREPKMKSFSKKTCVLAMILAVGSVAQAAYLGQLQVTSQASQNLKQLF